MGWIIGGLSLYGVVGLYFGVVYGNRPLIKLALYSFAIAWWILSVLATTLFYQMVVEQYY